MINKLLYGIRRFIAEIRGKHDYWHIPLYANNGADDKNYYLNLEKKGVYSNLSQEGVPILNYHGNEVEFSTTIFNYGLGLIELNNTGNKKKEINDVLKWAIVNQDHKGQWCNNFDEISHNLNSGWTSGMSQALGISFIIRCYYIGLIDKKSTLSICEKAIKTILEPPIYTLVNNCPYIEEYPDKNSHVLNGYIFSLWGILDWCILIKDFSLFNKFEASLKNLIIKYDFWGWSYYDLNKTLSSSFYHQLHIEQLKVLYNQTNEGIYLRFIKKWEIGLKLRIVFIILKSVQKLFNYKKIATLNNK